MIIFDFLLVVLTLFLFGLFIKRPMFHYIHTFIRFKHVNFGKHIRIHVKNLRKSMLMLKFHPEMKSLHVFFSFFHPEMKFHPCLLDRNEFMPGWNFISAKSCKQWETFHHRQGWFRSGTSFIPGWNFTYKHRLSWPISMHMIYISSSNK